MAAVDEALVQLKIRTEKMEHWSRWVGFILKLPFVAAAVVVLGGLIWMPWEAWRSDGIFIDSFYVAPSIASNGLDGDQVVAIVRDRLGDIRSRSTEASDGLSPTNSRVILGGRILQTDWRRDYRLSIPQTGVTIGEAATILHRLMGHDTNVSGQLVRSSGEMELTVRVGNRWRQIRGTDVNTMVAQAADAIFEEIDAYGYAIFLAKTGRHTDSTQRLIALAAGPADSAMRARALNALAANVIAFEGACEPAVRILASARHFKPDLPNIYGNLSNAYYCLGQDQRAADATSEEVRLILAQRGQRGEARNDRLLLEDADNLAGNYGEYRRRLMLYGLMEQVGFNDQSLRRALALAELRQVSESLAILRRWYAVRRWDPAVLASRKVAYWNLRYTQAVALGNWREAARAVALTNHFLQRSDDPYSRAQLTTQSLPLEVIALARAGEATRAATIAGRLPSACYLCARARAIAAEAARSRAEADDWFAEAIAIAPRLPFAYVEQGQARLRRGEERQALDLFDRAVEIGPAYADAYKGRGDALAALRRAAEAADAYRAAAALAPRWGAVRLRRAWALAHLRQVGAARTETCAAAGMDLAPPDRELLRRWVELARISGC
jgi:tetratricopeptide (TPR) repeat protein